MTHPFDDVITSVKAGVQARLGWLIYAQFGNGPMRVWQGVGELSAGGETWIGSAGTVEIKDIQVEQGFIANKIEITLSGVDAQFLVLAEESKEHVQNRPITVYLQAFGEDWQTIGSPVALWAGLMDRMSFEASVNAAKITLSCETVFATRNRPRASYFTDADQKERSPGDRGLEFIAVLQDRNVDQPVLPS